MTAGGQSVTFVSVGTGATDEWGNQLKSQSTTTITNCRFRPVSVSETVDYTDKTTTLWKLTKIRPIESQLLDAKPNDLLLWDNKTFEIDGVPKVFTDHTGSVYKVTVFAKLQQRHVA